MEKELGIKITNIDQSTNKNGVLHIVIGRTYEGEGYSGMTDGVYVKGKLTEVDRMRDSATIWSDKLDMPCAVKLRSLYAL